MNVSIDPKRAINEQRCRFGLAQGSNVGGNRGIGNLDWRSYAWMGGPE